jgi:hypothetical protein
VLQHVFVQPLKVILDHDLAADNSGLIDAGAYLVGADQQSSNAKVGRLFAEPETFMIVANFMFMKVIAKLTTLRLFPKDLLWRRRRHSDLVPHLSGG